uniref:McrB family protein n=1 Tax=Capnocytophaga cynodegmi TaxID=28189 RepID=UPI001BB3A467
MIQIKSDKSKVWKPSYNKIIESYNNQLFNEKGRTGGFKSYEDAIAKYLFENLDNKLIKSQTETLYKEEDFLQVIQFHPSYSYEDFVRGIVAKPNSNGDGITYEAENKILAKFAENAENDPDNNFVLIIDEINRANLSSVLGELIYALEYRGEAVDSMYEVDGSNKIILPPNLYIIGTMNTADRSVGHIDYAIRRRFAFVDVLPRDLSSEGCEFNSDLFEKVSQLFIKDFDLSKDYSKEEIKKSDYLSNEFDVKDVWLGHSYFIEQYEKDNNGEDIKDKPIDFRIRLEYEIKPILREYVKDGVLKEETLEKINNLGKEQ